jgi:hypothetical protein
MKPLKNRPSYAERRLAERKAEKTPHIALTDAGPRGVGLHPKKGEKGGACNRTACQRPAQQDPDGVRWFNHSTRKYYCGTCAWDLNTDIFNKRDAQEIWGHDLCTLEPA